MLVTISVWPAAHLPRSRFGRIESVMMVGQDRNRQLEVQSSETQSRGEIDTGCECDASRGEQQSTQRGLKEALPRPDLETMENLLMGLSETLAFFFFLFTVSFLLLPLFQPFLFLLSCVLQQDEQLFSGT